MFKKKKISWKENGWTILEEANAEEHLLEMSCLCEDGVVKEIICRHNDGDEENRFTGALKDGYSLPMPFEDFKTAYESGLIKVR